MTTDLLKKWLDELEPNETEFSPKVRSFDGSGGKLQCPWLHWRVRMSGRNGEGGSFMPTSGLDPVGIFLMQDWGNSSQALDDAIEKDIVPAINGAREDATLRNFLSTAWKEAIHDRWFASNAVWGIRAEREDGEAPKCGYLGAEVHKRAFLTWGRLVVRLCEKSVPANFRLVVAGEWASFNGFPGTSGQEDLCDYLVRWRNWVTKGYGRISRDELPDELSQSRLEACQGALAIYVPHPSTWKNGGKHNWMEGPDILASPRLYKRSLESGDL